MRAGVLVSITLSPLHIPAPNLSPHLNRFRYTPSPPHRTPSLSRAAAAPPPPSHPPSSILLLVLILPSLTPDVSPRTLSKQIERTEYRWSGHRLQTILPPLCQDSRSSRRQRRIVGGVAHVASPGVRAYSLTYVRARAICGRLRVIHVVGLCHLKFFYKNPPLPPPMTTRQSSSRFESPIYGSWPRPRLLLQPSMLSCRKG